VYRVDQRSGALIQLPRSPYKTGAFPVSVKVTPDRRFVYVTNQGSDSITGFQVDNITGQLTPIDGSPFSAGH